MTLGNSVVSVRGTCAWPTSSTLLFFLFFTSSASLAVLQIAQTTSRVITAYEFVTAANCLNGSISGQLIHCLSWSQARREKRPFSHLAPRRQRISGSSPPNPCPLSHGIYKLVSLTAGVVISRFVLGHSFGPTLCWSWNQVLMI